MQEPTDALPSIHPDQGQFYGSSRRRLTQLIDKIENKQRAQTFIDKYTHEMRLAKGAKYRYDPPGLTEKAEFFTAPPVKMFQRNSFIDEVSADTADVKQFRPIVKRTFLMLDLENLRDADATKFENYNAADYMLGKVAESLTEEVERLKKQFAGRNIRVEVGRYGGDEFALALVGDYTEEDLLRIGSDSLQKVQSLDAFYQRLPNEPIIRSKIKVKSGGFEFIEIDPEDVMGSEIFEYYFQQGVILNDEQIKIEKERYKNKIEDFRQSAVSRKRDYPVDVDSIDKKILYLTTRHPEFKDVYEDLMTSTLPTELVQSLFLDFVENNIYDRLLGANVTSFADLAEHLNKREFSSLWIFDGKFIKETNDALGYPLADKLIQNIWREISSKISPEDRDNLFFARRGGTFALALRNEARLSQETRASLQKLKAVPFPEGDFTVPVGISEIDLQALTPSEDKPTPLKVAERQANEDWLRTVFKQMVNVDIEIALPQPDSPLYNTLDEANLIGFTRKYFTSDKRGYERVKDALVFLQMEVGELANKTFNDIRSRLQLIFDYEKKKRYS
ncbi:hypothetical protein A3C28_02315 [Candidatus Roizmanbacteria bacterium RIFCSPHIGHO2_02_FULL_39_9]|uniref:GGDEF domain-containing protein n=2 Tax=Candidatus Roizmaniibacteriota TaxID=1752723 RepID=A0A1F7HBT2_9BACT|nr:MAG: hypothetical protein A3C28_02315 [Candidatus Roizmanbacteria bacterium RIFCSPHIGHO2_02_FULL_39_9]